MGGRIHGFLGGVLLTASLTYYTKEYFEKNKIFVSNSLRTSNHIINNRILTDNDKSQEAVPYDKSTNVIKRVSSVETCKDIWNEEVIRFANWVYSINWYQWGLNTDKKIHELTDKIANSFNEKK